MDTRDRRWDQPFHEILEWLKVLIPGLVAAAVSVSVSVVVVVVVVVVDWLTFAGAFAELACLAERDLE